MEATLYSIEVTEDIATKIRILAEYGVFAAKNGSADIHFDAQGNISQVVLHTFHRVMHRDTGLLHRQDERIMKQ